MILPFFSDWQEANPEKIGLSHITDRLEKIKNDIFARFSIDLKNQAEFIKSNSFMNEFAKEIPAITVLPVPWTQKDFDFLRAILTSQYLHKQSINADLKYLHDDLHDVLIPGTVENILDQLYIFGDDSISLQTLWKFSLALSQPDLFLQSLIEIFRNEKYQYHVEWAQGLYDYFHPQIEQSKSGLTPTEGTDYQILIVELFTAIILRYPREDFSFQVFSYRLFTDFLCICRHSTGKLLVQTFRCFAELYSKLGNVLIEESMNKIIVEIVLTFTPNHPLFRQAYYLIQHNNSVYDDFKYLKLLIRLKVALSIQLFEFIDSVLSSHDIISKPFIIMQFLMQTCVTKQVWSLATAHIIQKHARLFFQSKRVRDWMKLFVRRSLQWVAVVAKLRRYRNRRFLIARSFRMFVECTPESIANEIKTGASTLIQSGAYPELSFYFTPGPFDQIFLDEIEVLDVLPDLTEMLLWPRESFRSDQLQKIEAKRNNSRNDIKSFKFLEDSSDKFINGASTLETSLTCFYSLIVILIIVVVLVIFS